jgi:hypothetical protein
MAAGMGWMATGEPAPTRSGAPGSLGQDGGFAQSLGGLVPSCLHKSGTLRSHARPLPPPFLVSPVSRRARPRLSEAVSNPPTPLDLDLCPYGINFFLPIHAPPPCPPWPNASAGNERRQ